VVYRMILRSRSSGAGSVPSLEEALPDPEDLVIARDELATAPPQAR
jgi:hypothetical protein